MHCPVQNPHMQTNISFSIIQFNHGFELLCHQAAKNLDVADPRQCQNFLRHCRVGSAPSWVSCSCSGEAFTIWVASSWGWHGRVQWWALGGPCLCQHLPWRCLRPSWSLPCCVRGCISCWYTFAHLESPPLAGSRIFTMIFWPPVQGWSPSGRNQY